MSARVLLVGPRGQGGEEVYVRTLLDNPPTGVTYLDAGGAHRGAPGAPSIVPGEMFLNRFIRPWTAPNAGFRCLALLSKFDLVHLHGIPAVLCFRRGAPIVVSEGSSLAVYLHDYLNWDDARLEKSFGHSRPLYRAFGIHDRLLALERVSCAYVFSHWARDINIRWGADPDKMAVLYPGFPVPPVAARAQREEFTFLFVGTDFERKGGFELVEAFADLATADQDARLVIVSSDPSKPDPDRLIHAWVSEERKTKVLARLEQLRRSDRVELHPLLDRETLFRDFYPHADAFVMPSHAEGFGFTNVEAHSFSLPVISSTVGAIPEVVEDKVNGLLVEPGDIIGLTAAMRTLLGDRNRAKQMGEAGRQRFLERFTLERFRGELGRIYARALDRS